MSHNICNLAENGYLCKLFCCHSCLLTKMTRFFNNNKMNIVFHEKNIVSDYVLKKILLQIECQKSPSAGCMAISCKKRLTPFLQH